MEGLYIAGSARDTQEHYAVRHAWTQEVIAEVAEAARDDVEAAVAAARAVLAKPLSIHERYRILETAAERLGAEAESFARTLAQEAGKPVRDARVEVARAQQTLRYAAVAARTLKGEEVPIRGNPGVENRLAFTVRKPYGVVLAITPFNFPLNLALHKVAPALAAGNAVILKPAPATPLTALKLARLLESAGLPPGWLNVVTGSRPEVGEWLVSHPGVNLISFTGSAAVGQIIRRNAGLKPVLLELGSNSANIVHEDADLDQAAAILSQRAYAYAGQVCISVQRIYVHRRIYDAFRTKMAQAVSALKVGNPEEESVDLGPMINQGAAERATQWVQEALNTGAEPVVTGAREGSVVKPWLLERVALDAKVMTEEVFAPVAVMTPYDTIEEAVALANRSRYGLQAGLFTRDIKTAFYAAEHLEVGGLIVNDSSSFRADNMPYGGVKDSGLGREGPEYAVYEMTYPTVVVFNL
ncbi:MAG: aldehyde dehydrogenase family protein [Firmicutes bacterium]|nr:aldehyde dehydrogenase family protein [Bacillota bacterium]